MKRNQIQRVILTHCSRYCSAEFADKIDTVLSSLLVSKNLRNKVVLLKPNFVSSRGPCLACTDVSFLAAVASWFRDCGAKVAIGDSPAFGSTKSAMKNHGMTGLLVNSGCESVNFSTPVIHTLSGGITLGIAREALECDLLVNLPKLKAHNQMYVTGAVKNFFGTVVGMQKAALHMKRGKSHDGFAKILLELPTILPENITLIDGIEVMHRSGPMDGELLRLGCLGGAENPVALDTALLNVLELPLSQSPLWRVAMEAGHPGSDPADIEYPAELPRFFHGSGFQAPATLNPIRFNPFRLVMSTMRRVKMALGG